MMRGVRVVYGNWSNLDVCGGQIVDCPAEIADKTDRIITMLPSSPNVIEVYTGPNGILK